MWSDKTRLSTSTFVEVSLLTRSGDRKDEFVNVENVWERSAMTFTKPIMQYIKDTRGFDEFYAVLIEIFFKDMIDFKKLKLDMLFIFS